MANAKNTIQNIPLTGELCLNTLKTDVKAFEGYNEKNSTVFGGELSPVWKKESELGNKENSFTIFNSKGEPFTIDYSRPHYFPTVSDKDNNVIGWTNSPIELKDCAPDDAEWYAFISNGGIAGQLYIDSSGRLFCRLNSGPSGIGGIDLEDLQRTEWKYLYTFSATDVHYNKLQSIDVMFKRYLSGSNSLLSITLAYISKSRIAYIYCLYGIPAVNGYTSTNQNYDETKYVQYPVSLNEYFTDTGFVNISSPTSQGLNQYVSFVPYAGKKKTDSHYTVNLITMTYEAPTYEPAFSRNDEYYFYPSGVLDPDSYDNKKQYIKYDIQDYPQQTSEVWRGGSYLVYKSAVNQNVTRITRPNTGGSAYTGHDGDYFIPGFRAYRNSEGRQGPYVGEKLIPTTKEVYLNGDLYVASLAGMFVTEPGLLESPNYYINDCTVSFRGSDKKWRTFIADDSFTHNSDKRTAYGFPHNLESVKKAVINNRYIFLYFNQEEHTGLYDIETKQFIETSLDYVDTFVPTYVSTLENFQTTGIVYASGYNVNYTISKNPFIGHLTNPNEMTGFPEIESDKVLYDFSFDGLDRYVDYFFSLGDSVQSAEYQFSTPRTITDYKGTLYPIDSNGNIIYPITWDSQIINGYSNNDLIKIGDTAYPLIYWNNNQKMYAYYLLSSMENVKGAFSLQGQQYTFDDKNIYNVTFDNGVIQNVTAVCYIKNMQFLGTLPTSAVFYSKFNKTFYQFTGDAILSKMFEASDIDEIKMVGQNPSSLSLWICTDKGVYILSDTDMFRLEYDVSDIYFEESKTILITEGETNWIENDISLYDIGNGATETPIKLQTKFYGLGGELKANYDCWYIRLHDKDRKTGKLKLKVNTITNSSFETEEKTFTIEPNQYDSNNTVYIRYQPKYQTAVATQLELESDIAIYQLSLGVNQNDAVAQQSKLNF